MFVSIIHAAFVSKSKVSGLITPSFLAMTQRCMANGNIHLLNVCHTGDVIPLMEMN